MLAYLSRYTHRVAISNRRLLAFGDAGVTMRYKDYRRDGADRQRVMTLSADGPREGMTSKNPKVSAILSELAAGKPPMQTILKLKALADEEPDNVEAQYHLGLFSWQTGQYDKAMERFRKTIELDGKEYPDAYAYLGQAYASLDSTDRALAALETYKTLVTDTALINGADRFIADIKNKHQH